MSWTLNLECQILIFCITFYHRLLNLHQKERNSKVNNWLQKLLFFKRCFAVTFSLKHMFTWVFFERWQPRLKWVYVYSQRIIYFIHNTPILQFCPYSTIFPIVSLSAKIKKIKYTCSLIDDNNKKLNVIEKLNGCVDKLSNELFCLTHDLRYLQIMKTIVDFRISFFLT